MANIDKHPAGSFCWVELATTDQDAAKNFYTALFGWSVVDSPIGPNDFYSSFKLAGRDTGAAYTMRKEQRAQGVPPHWMLYIAVDNADQAVTKAAQIGGTVLAPAFDVMDIGRMAVVQDPTGAIFSLWQAKKQSGIGISGDNTFCWADLSTPKPDQAAKFYSDLFGWQVMKDEKDPSGYTHIKNGENFIGGIPPAEHRNPNAPPHWLLYFQVVDVEASTAKAAQLGGKVLMPARKMENVGTWSIVADPQGAVFALFKSAR
ncbi:MAG: VOC family protein [Candidatus Angelobacter sp.]